MGVVGFETTSLWERLGFYPTASSRMSRSKLLNFELAAVRHSPSSIGPNHEDLQHERKAGTSSEAFSTRNWQRLDTAFQNGHGCPHDVLTRRLSGVTDWKPDPKNIAIARAAVANLDLYLASGEKKDTIRLLLRPKAWLSNLRQLCGDRWIIDARQLALARKLRIIDKLPHVTVDEIDDLNESDFFVKFLAVAQILWLCIQIIARASHNLPITQLEIVTLAFAVCSITTYGLLYSRPKDVQTVREIRAIRYPTPGMMTRIASAASHDGTLRRDIPIPNFAHSAMSLHFNCSLTVVLIVFGGLHLAAWDFEFPTEAESLFWKISAVATLAAWPLFLAISFLIAWCSMHAMEDKVIDSAFMEYAGAGAFFVTVGAFVAARAFILVEMVRSLAFQPPETFRTTWAANVPHVG